MKGRRPAVVPNNNYTHENIVKLLKESDLDLKVFKLGEYSAVGIIYSNDRNINFFIEHNIIYLNEDAEVMLDILERFGIPCDFNEALYISDETLELWGVASGDL